MTQEQIRELKKIRDLIAGAPVDCLGSGSSDNCAPWPIRDEVVDSLSRVISSRELVETGIGQFFEDILGEIERGIDPADESPELILTSVYQRLQAAHARYAGGEKRSASGETEKNLIHVGFTNPFQIEYAKDEEGAFYPDSENECYIPLFMLKIHAHRLELSTGSDLRGIRPVGYAGGGEADLEQFIKANQFDVERDNASDVISADALRDWYVLRPAQAGPDTDRLLALIEEYWDIAWQQGFEQRHHDDEKGSAQNKLSEIQAMLSAARGNE